jgi:hypothetical protein
MIKYSWSLYSVYSDWLWLVGCVVLREKRNACTMLVGKPNGKRPLGRPGHRWEDNIKMDLG